MSNDYIYGPRFDSHYYHICTDICRGRVSFKDFKILLNEHNIGMQVSLNTAKAIDSLDVPHDYDVLDKVGSKLKEYRTTVDYSNKIYEEMLKC